MEQLVADHLALKNALRTARVYRDLTVEEVGDRMGTSPDIVKAFESYHSNPTLSQVRDYASAVGVRFETVVFYDGLG